MLYELIAVVRPGSLTEIREIALSTSRLLLSANSTIRGITNWGPFLLPKPTTKHQSKHHQGHYFLIRFDSSAKAQEEVRRSLGLDPRMIRFGVVKIGDKLVGRGKGRLGGMSEIQGWVDWLGGGGGREFDGGVEDFINKQAGRGGLMRLFGGR